MLTNRGVRVSISTVVASRQMRRQNRKGQTRETAQIRRVRRHALTLVKSERQNCVTPSPLTQKLAETYYANATEQELVALAQRVLQAARLTTFTVQTKAEAVSIIEGIRPAGRSYAR